MKDKTMSANDSTGPPQNPRKRFATNIKSLQKEVSIRTSRSRGPGGQRRDKKETAVRLTHRPSGITVVASERRSLATNLEIAFQRLKAKLAKLNRPTKQRTRTKPTASAIQKRLEQKKRQSEKKKVRRSLDISSEEGTE